MSSILNYKKRENKRKRILPQKNINFKRQNKKLIFFSKQIFISNIKKKKTKILFFKKRNKKKKIKNARNWSQEQTTCLWRSTLLLHIDFLSRSGNNIKKRFKRNMLIKPSSFRWPPLLRIDYLGCLFNNHFNSKMQKSIH